MSSQSEQWESFLTTKIRIPQLPVEFVSRPRLLQQLNTTVKHKLTLVRAPAGYGKTVMLSEWANLSALPLVWLSLDQNDNDPVCFWKYIVTTLETEYTGISASLLPLLCSLRPPPISSLLTLLINALASSSLEIILVLDDYHVINEQAVHEAVTFLLMHQPPQLHLVIATRTTPPLPLAHIHAQAQLTEIDVCELRFTQQEAQEYLAQAMSTNLSIERRTWLIEQSEGWIAGLQMGRLVMRARTEQMLQETFSISAHSHLEKYLMEEVLLQQPEVQSFLLSTSILEHFTASLCNAVTERNDGLKMLHIIENANLFIVSLDSKHQWYRYHHLFSEVLRAQLQERSESPLAPLYVRASLWCEQHSLFDDAIRYALAAEDFARATGLINQIVEALIIERGECLTLLHWLDNVPKHILHTHARLNLFRALALLLSLQTEVAVTCLEEVETVLRENQSQNNPLQGELATIRALIRNAQGDLPGTLVLCQQALAELPHDHLKWRISIKQVQGLAFFLSGDRETASHIFTTILDESRTIGDLYTIIAAFTSIADVTKDQGRLAQAALYYQRALRVVHDSEEPFYAPLTASSAIGLGALHYEWDELNIAEEYIMRGLKQSKYYDTTRILPILGYIHLANIKQAQLDTENALYFLEQAEQEAQNASHIHLKADIVALRAKFFLAQSMSKEALQWAHRFRVRERAMRQKDMSQASLEFQRTILAYILLSTGDTASALEVLSYMQDIAIVSIHEKRTIEILLLRALAFHVQQDSEQVIPVLAPVLIRAERGGYIRTLVDMGTPQLSELLALPQIAFVDFPDVSLDYRKTLLQLLSVQSDQNVQTALLTTTSLTPSLLSRREQEVLQCIVMGYTTDAIARFLIITPNTVKTHIKRIFAKLGVSNRLEAIAQAKVLHLL